MTTAIRRAVPLRYRRRLRRAGESAIAVGVRPVRATVRWVVARVSPLRPVVADWGWLWQPGWSRRHHDRVYAEHDPYGFDNKPFEREKYQRLIELLGDRRYARGLEVGCSEGAFSERLVELCDELVGVDISEAAVRRARARLPGAPVTFERRTLPYDVPEGSFDLIVCSDVLYLWEPGTLGVGLEWLADQLRPGGRLALLHYLGALSAPMTGTEVHRNTAERAAALGLRHVVGIDWPDFGPHGSGYRYDCWDRPAARSTRPL